MPSSEIRIRGLPGLREIVPGDDLGELLPEAVARSSLRVQEADIFVVTQKIVSKAEGRIVKLDSVEPSAVARAWAELHHKDPRIVEVVLREARRIVRMDRGILIVETQNGFICANAGVDASNAPQGTVTLLPEDPDGSARRLRTKLQEAFGAPLGVIISDTFGRPWREGLTNVALGVAGLPALIDYRGERDPQGRMLQYSVVAVADELAAAAELVMGKTTQVPVALIQGFDYERFSSQGDYGESGRGRDLLRSPGYDLFR